VDGSRETLAFSQNGESVGEVSDVVLMWHILGLDWSVSFEWLSWIESRDSIGAGVFIKSVENSMNVARVCSEGSVLKLHKGFVVRSNGFAQHACF